MRWMRLNAFNVHGICWRIGWFGASSPEKKTSQFDVRFWDFSCVVQRLGGSYWCFYCLHTIRIHFLASFFADNIQYFPRMSLYPLNQATSYRLFSSVDGSQLAYVNIAISLSNKMCYNNGKKVVQKEQTNRTDQGMVGSTSLRSRTVKMMAIQLCHFHSIRQYTRD